MRGTRKLDSLYLKFIPEVFRVKAIKILDAAWDRLCIYTATTCTQEPYTYTVSVHTLPLYAVLGSLIPADGLPLNEINREKDRESDRERERVKR